MFSVLFLKGPGKDVNLLLAAWIISDYLHTKCMLHRKAGFKPDFQK